MLQYHKNWIGFKSLRHFERSALCKMRRYGVHPYRFRSRYSIKVDIEKNLLKIRRRAVGD